MGVVHLASSASGLRLAVKVVHAEFAADPEFRARFRQEVAAARRVSGAFTAAVVDADPDSARPWMATLYVEGPTLAEQVKRKPLDAAGLSRLGAGLAEALRDIHRAGVVHRDLKPSNVLMAADGPKVIDFGISRPYDSDLRTETGKLIGTPPYMAPEQFQRPREVGPEADVFAMGSVLVHAATGRGPFDSDSPYLVAYQVVHHEPDLSGVPAELVPLIARCLAKDPADRPTTDALLAELRSAAYPTSEDTRAFIPAPRAPLGAAGAAASAAPEVVTHRRERVEGGAGAQAGRRKPRGVGRAVLVGGGLLAAGAAVAAYVVVGGGTDGPAADRDGRQVTAGQRPAPWSVPLVRGGGMPVCAAGGADAVYCAGPGLAAVRLSAVDGSVRWSVPAADGGRRVGADRAPVLAGGLVHTVAADGRRLDARDPATGAVRWSRPLPESATVLYAGAGGETVLVGEPGGKVTARSAASGERVWSERLGGVGSVLMAGPTGLLFVVTPAGDGGSTSVAAADAGSGEVRWRVRARGELAPAGAAAGAVFLLRSDRYQLTDAVVRVDLTTRAVRVVPLRTPVDQAQAGVGADGTVYLAGFAGGVTAVGAAGERWRVETLVSRVSRPVPVGERVYLAAADGRVLALSAAGGRVLGATSGRGGGGVDLAPNVPWPVVGAGGVVVSGAPDGVVSAVSGDPAGW